MSKLSSALPKDHGLYGRKLVDEPTAVHAVIALVDVSRITTDVDTGDREPTVRVLHVEVITQADLPDAQRLLRDAIEKRTGATMLDGFSDDLDQNLKAAFGNVDPHTGEMLDGES
jgi:hypothetical protein